MLYTLGVGRLVMSIVKVTDTEITHLIQHLCSKSESYDYIVDDDWVVLECEPTHGWVDGGVKFTIECASGGYHVLSGIYALYMQYPNVLSFLLWASQHGILGTLGIVVVCTVGAVAIPVFYLKSTGVFTSADLLDAVNMVVGEKKEIKIV